MGGSIETDPKRHAPVSNRPEDSRSPSGRLDVSDTKHISMITPSIVVCGIIIRDVT
jgi:hypothetical protein